MEHFTSDHQADRVPVTLVPEALTTQHNTHSPHQQFLACFALHICL